MEEDRRAAGNGNGNPHVLVIPFSAQGHINPMLEFCKRLVPKGLKPTLVNTVFLSKTNIAHRDSIALETISDGFDEGGFAQAESHEHYLTTYSLVGSKTLTHLIEKLDANGNHVDAIIYDAFLPWVLDVAKKFGRPTALFLTQSGAVSSIYYHVHRKIIALPLSGSPISLPGLPQLQPSETPSYVHIYGSYPAFSNLIMGQFSHIDQVDWVLFSSFYELEQEVLNWMGKHWRVRSVGPTIPSAYLDKRLENDEDYGINIFQPDDGTCINWLNDKPIHSVVYAAFGSMVELKPEQLEEIAWALNNCNFNYLWVVRASEQEKLPKNVTFEKPQKGLIVTWSPQLQVLSHESIGCFVTHCGFNSVLEAISLGVAMVGMPQWTDQPTNAKFVEDVWCMGVRAKQDKNGIVKREVLESCIREVMEGERGREIKRNAVKWKNSAKDAVDAGGSSDKNIDEFVAELKRLKSC